MFERTTPLEATPLKPKSQSFAESKATEETNQIIAAGEAKNAVAAQKHLHPVQLVDGQANPSATATPEAKPVTPSDKDGASIRKNYFLRNPMAPEQRNSEHGSQENTSFLQGKNLKKL